MHIYAGLSPYFKPRLRVVRGVIVVTFLGLLVVAGAKAHGTSVTVNTTNTVTPNTGRGGGPIPATRATGPGGGIITNP